MGNLLVILSLIISSSEGTKSYSLSVTQDLGVSVLEDVDNRNDSRALGQTLLLSCGNKRPELVDVDGRAPEEVAGEVEVTHTNLTEVTRMVLIEVGANHRNRHQNHNRKPNTLSHVEESRIERTGGGADHQQDHDLLGACGACQHGRGRRRRVRGACESW